MPTSQHGAEGVGRGAAPQSTQSDEDLARKFPGCERRIRPCGLPIALMQRRRVRVLAPSIYSLGKPFLTSALGYHLCQITRLRSCVSRSQKKGIPKNSSGSFSVYFSFSLRSRRPSKQRPVRHREEHKRNRHLLIRVIRVVATLQRQPGVSGCMRVLAKSYS
jgi:hypothetical protein